APQAPPPAQPLSSVPPVGAAVTPGPTEYPPGPAEERVRDKVEELCFEEQRIRAEADRRVQEGAAPPPPVAMAPLAPAADLHTAEQRLQDERAAQERGMEEAEERLRQIEERTRAAEQRAEEAKRLEGLR